jgi:ankyrin repeat protein
MTKESTSDDLYIHSEIESAIIQGNIDQFHSLISDANLTHCSDNGSNLLHKAAISGRAEIATELLERGIKVDAQDDSGKTPLHRALENENDEVAILLIEHEADLTAEDQYGNQPLWRAVFKANYELSKLLLDHGADPTHENEAGESPLSMAEEAEAQEFIELFEEY